MTPLASTSLFISFEGIDGSGKTTQTAWLARALADAGHCVVETREPGGTPLGRQLREILLADAPRTPEAETLLFAADRAQHVAEVIRPALARGDIVVCDRFADSTRAYQGGGRQLSADFIETSIRLATGGLEPGLTFLLDLPVAAAGARLRAAPGRAGDRFEMERPAFYERVRATFLALARAHPARIYKLDAAQPPDALQALVWEAVTARLSQSLPSASSRAR